MKKNGMKWTPSTELDIVEWYSDSFHGLTSNRFQEYRFLPFSRR